MGNIFCCASAEDMIALSNKAIRAWEKGDKQMYKACLANDARMIIPAYKVDQTGFDNIWKIRESMGPAPINPHTQHSHYIDGNVVTCLSVVHNKKDARAVQVSEIRYTISCGQIIKYEQENLVGPLK